MDLALQMGTTAGALGRSMPEAEFVDFQRLAAKRGGLPWRRLEFYLAQIALVVAQCMGGAGKLTLADFMFDTDYSKDADDEDDAEAADEAREFFGFKPIK